MIFSHKILFDKYFGSSDALRFTGRNAEQRDPERRRRQSVAHSFAETVAPRRCQEYKE